MCYLQAAWALAKGRKKNGGAPPWGRVGQKVPLAGWLDSACRKAPKMRYISEEGSISKVFKNDNRIVF
jgi:hypothetical protein